jgi:hypothetical protein
MDGPPRVPRVPGHRASSASCGPRGYRSRVGSPKAVGLHWNGVPAPWPSRPPTRACSARTASAKLGPRNTKEGRERWQLPPRPGAEHDPLRACRRGALGRTVCRPGSWAGPAESVQAFRPPGFPGQLHGQDPGRPGRVPAHHHRYPELLARLRPGHGEGPGGGARAGVPPARQAQRRKKGDADRSDKSPDRSASPFAVAPFAVGAGGVGPDAPVIAPQTSGRCYWNVFTGEVITPDSYRGAPGPLVGALLGRFPVALLRSLESSGDGRRDD